MITCKLEAWAVGVKACAGGGVQDPRFGRPCSMLTRRGQQQAGESSCLINLSLANALAACTVEVNRKTGKVSLSLEGKAALQEWPGCLGGGFHPPCHLQPARTALSPSLCPSFCLVSLPCVFTRTLQCFSDALVCGSESFPALPAGSSALACDVRSLSPLHSSFLGKAFCQGIPFTFLKLSTAVFCSLFLFSRSG